MPLNASTQRVLVGEARRQGSPGLLHVHSISLGFRSQPTKMRTVTTQDRVLCVSKTRLATASVSVAQFFGSTLPDPMLRHWLACRLVASCSSSSAAHRRACKVTAKTNAWEHAGLCRDPPDCARTFADTVAQSIHMPASHGPPKSSASKSMAHP